MPITPYRSGYLVELKARDELKKLGASVVVRSAKSSTPIDLIAILPEQKQVWLVQCKAKQEAPEDLSKLKKRFKHITELGGEYQVIPYVYMKRNNMYKFIELE